MSRKAQVGFLLAMVAATCLVQAVVISRAAVPALDAVRFVNSARSIEHLGLLSFLRDRTEPPLFPVMIWGVHATLVALVGEFREAWALSVHLAAALPLIVLPVPVFCLSKRLVGPDAAILGTVLVLCLPELIRLGADGISDSTHLFWLSLALAFLVAHLMSSKQPLTAILAGAATALALLTRSEAAVLVAAFALVLVFRGVRRREVPWRSALPYVAGLTAILGPYGLLLTLTPEEPAMQLACATSGSVVPLDPEFKMPGGESLSFAPKDPTTSIRRRGVTAAAIQLADELPKAFGYAPGLLALVGFWILRRRPPTDADRLLQIFCALLFAAILFHTVREGYLAARHLLPFTVAAAACMGFGTQVVGDRLSRVLRRAEVRRTFVPHAAIVLTVFVASLSMLYGVRPLHPSRAGHRSAATWLARNARRGDRVVDTQGWTGLYSGLATVPYEKSRSELLHPNLRYLVIEDRELSFDSRRSRTIQRLLDQAGTQVASFPAPPTAGRQLPNVLIYEWNVKGR